MLDKDCKLTIYQKGITGSRATGAHKLAYGFALAMLGFLATF